MTDHHVGTTGGRVRLTRRGKAVLGGLALVLTAGASMVSWPASGDQRGAQALSQAATIAGLSGTLRSQIPADSRQVVVVTGAGQDSSDATATLYSRPSTSSPWVRGASWPAHNALKGWTADHHFNDLRSPVGVFTLSDAGGRLTAPAGTRFPYDHNREFVASGRGSRGESLAHAFDYVIAIDYNRVQGVSPLDPQRPDGADKGGGVWIHVDHGGPTQACVSLPADAMRTLLTTLDPARHPVIAMGPS
jgi:L,D-peptidoglycan transpeptidase YkuD (ErfK/YbiS/YcfS/YnhG family)